MAALSFELIVVLFWFHSVVGGLWLIARPDPSAPQFCTEIARCYSQLAWRWTSFDFVEIVVPHLCRHQGQSSFAQTWLHDCGLQTDARRGTFSRPWAWSQSRIAYTMPGRQQREAPCSRLIPNGTNWQGGSHGYSSYWAYTRRIGHRRWIWVLRDVVQNGLRTGRHLKEKQAKMKHHFVRVLRGPKKF